MARYKREVPVIPEHLEGDALRGYWQVKLRAVKQWLLSHGDATWTNPELSDFSNELGRVARPLNSSTSNVDVDQLDAVYDRALTLGYSSRTEQK